MRMTAFARPVSAAFLAAACLALAACSSSAAKPAPDAADATDATDGSGGNITYWLAPRTSEVDLQLVTTQPTTGF